MKKILILLLVLATLPFALFACGEEEDTFDGTYTLKFIANGVEYYSVKTDGKSTVDLPANPTKNGYDFKGWFFKENDGTDGKEFTADYFLTSPFTSRYEVCVYAKFEISQSPIPGGGSEYDPGSGDTYYDPDGWTEPDK